MNILCATDFTAPAALASRVAANLAVALRAELHLLHVAQPPGAQPGPAALPFALSSAELERRRALLACEASALRALGVTVIEEFLEGLPDEAIVARAEALGAELVVLGPTGERESQGSRLGGTAARVIKTSPVPVLVAREEQSVERWLLGTPLRVLLGVDPSPVTSVALDKLALWRSAGELELVVAHVHYRRGQTHSYALEAQHELALSEQIDERIARVAGLGRARVRVVAGLGSVGEHLLELAASESADLIMIGTHHQRDWSRALHGSVALDIVARWHGNIVVAPLTSRAPGSAARRVAVRRILVPIDLSPLSKQAIPWACSLLPSGGRLHLLHVVTPTVSASGAFGTLAGEALDVAELGASMRATIEAELRAAVPHDAYSRDIGVDIEITAECGTATAITHAAERCGAEFVCISSHGRTGQSKAMLGPVAEGVMRRSAIPVFVVPTAEGD